MPAVWDAVGIAAGEQLGERGAQGGKVAAACSEQVQVVIDAISVHPFGWGIRITAFSSPPWTWLLGVEGHEHGRRVQQATAGGGGEGIEAAFVTAAGRLTQLPWDQAAASVRFEDLAPVSAFPVVPGRR
ncbi:hypothetical protein [Streptomyces sp. NBC_01808]|uniref:hypothetical protein n=1 Tax=Streptomyces sp. NBC_01808 TaxID=2975947 RepID=UPI002DD9A95A|nr:hypothetical protein [Streptomyces sp. NBC_01808]